MKRNKFVTKLYKIYYMKLRKDKKFIQKKYRKNKFIKKKKIVTPLNL